MKILKSTLNGYCNCNCPCCVLNETEDLQKERERGGGGFETDDDLFKFLAFNETSSSFSNELINFAISGEQIAEARWKRTKRKKEEDNEEGNGNKTGHERSSRGCVSRID